MISLFILTFYVNQHVYIYFFFNRKQDILKLYIKTGHFVYYKNCYNIRNVSTNAQLQYFRCCKLSKDKTGELMENGAQLEQTKSIIILKNN